MEVEEVVHVTTETSHRSIPSTAPGGRRDRPSTPARRTVIGALVGATPGALLVLVPAVLHAVGLITADQSQIGFAGVPLMLVGLTVGALARSPGGAGALVGIGLGAGFLVGAVGGVLVTELLRGAGFVVPGIWVVVVPVLMIAGAALGARRG
jgi:hypothetical protein